MKCFSSPAHLTVIKITEHNSWKFYADELLLMAVWGMFRCMLYVYEQRRKLKFLFFLLMITSQFTDILMNSNSLFHAASWTEKLKKLVKTFRAKCSLTHWRDKMFHVSWQVRIFDFFFNFKFTHGYVHVSSLSMFNLMKFKSFLNLISRFELFNILRASSAFSSISITNSLFWPLV